MRILSACLLFLITVMCSGRTEIIVPVGELYKKAETVLVCYLEKEPEKMVLSTHENSSYKWEKVQRIVHFKVEITLKGNEEIKSFEYKYNWIDLIEDKFGDLKSIYMDGDLPPLRITSNPDEETFPRDFDPWEKKFEKYVPYLLIISRNSTKIYELNSEFRELSEVISKS